MIHLTEDCRKTFLAPNVLNSKWWGMEMAKSRRLGRRLWIAYYVVALPYVILEIWLLGSIGFDLFDMQFVDWTFWIHLFALFVYIPAYVLYPFLYRRLRNVQRMVPGAIQVLMLIGFLKGPLTVMLEGDSPGVVVISAVFSVYFPILIGLGSAALWLRRDWVKSLPNLEEESSAAACQEGE